jgi:hypothetical protein
MSKSTWTGDVNRDWDDADNWSPAGVPDASSDVVITTGPSVQVSASIGTVNSITDSYALGFESAGTNTVATFLDITGHLYVDSKAGAGGTILNIGGTLTNRRHLTIGNATLSASDKVTATSLDNAGSIDLSGSGANQALLDIAGSAGFGTAEDLSGNVQLAGDSVIEFASGQITSLAGYLYLNGNDAFVEDKTAPGSNSALMGLASIGSEARLVIEEGASMSTTGALTNSGVLEVYSADASLSVAKGLTNSGSLAIENYGVASSPSVNSVTAASFVNSGTVILSGNTNNSATLNVSGALTNNGSISITDDTEELAGAVGGTGSFTLYGAKLQFDSSVSSGQTIEDLLTGHAGTLTLEQAQNFAATLSGFGTRDTIDATNFVETGTHYNFVENSAMTGGTLTLTDTSLSLTANILMTGDYSNPSFTLAHDSGTGTLVKFV